MTEKAMIAKAAIPIGNPSPVTDRARLHLYTKPIFDQGVLTEEH